MDVSRATSVAIARVRTTQQSMCVELQAREAPGIDIQIHKNGRRQDFPHPDEAESLGKLARDILTAKPAACTAFTVSLAIQSTSLFQFVRRLYMIDWSVSFSVR